MQTPMDDKDTTLIAGEERTTKDINSVTKANQEELENTRPDNPVRPMPTPAEGLQPNNTCFPAIRPHAYHTPQIARLPSPERQEIARNPPKFLRMATITCARTSDGPSLYYEEPRRGKAIPWNEATDARPPLRIDMEGPTPWTYTPRNKPPQERNAPSFSFGRKCYSERDGGARTSWLKTWYHTPHVWLHKVDFNRDNVWPSPSHYDSASAAQHAHTTSPLFERQKTVPDLACMTRATRRGISTEKLDDMKHPSPGDYEISHSDEMTKRRGFSFSHGARRGGTLLWGSKEKTPGPGAYEPRQAVRQSTPAFTIRGLRREKSHVLGPFATF